jgi:hypothetical protein
METLSKYLSDQIAWFDESLTAEELAAQALDREKLMESVEGLFDKTTPTPFTGYHFTRKLFANYPRAADVLETERDVLESVLDDCFSRLLLSDVPRMVSRALQLEPLLVEQNAEARENPYLREASRCYLYGLLSASVALCRSALDRAFSNRIPPLLQSAAGGDSLETLIKTARSSILKHATKICDRADSVRRIANGIVHGRACKDREALRVLNDTRDIIVYLYGNSR